MSGCTKYNSNTLIDEHGCENMIGWKACCGLWASKDDEDHDYYDDAEDPLPKPKSEAEHLEHLKVCIFVYCLLFSFVACTRLFTYSSTDCLRRITSLQLLLLATDKHAHLPFTKQSSAPYMGRF